MRVFLKQQIFKSGCQLRRLSNGPELISTTVDDKAGIAVLQLQKSPVNSLSLEFLTELKAKVTECEIEKCKSIIFTSAFHKNFSAGLDFKELLDPDLDRLKAFMAALHDAWMKLYSCRLPTVSLVNGHAIAGGCVIPLSSDYRIMCTNFTIGLNESVMGLPVPSFLTDGLINVIGVRQGETALTTGHLFTTEEALKVGLIDQEVGSKEEGMILAENHLTGLSSISLEAYSITKCTIRRKAVERMLTNRREDLDILVKFTTNEDIQKKLHVISKNLKNPTTSNKSV